MKKKKRLASMSTKVNSNKLYVVRKYIYAPSAEAALKLEKKAPVDDVWVDDKWKELNTQKEDATIGYVQ